jgi:hypothetical protein
LHSFIPNISLNILKSEKQMSSESLLSNMRYTEQQFLDVLEKLLPKLSSNVTYCIGANVWKNGGDIRDVISIGKLAECLRFYA